ncbi:type II secretion system F family protein [Roseiconus lacunae]|uniref:Type II secretion system F family protein n=1 Tax=Roseiconus lacunae TaxID=2605694 RepID=A0ABT7PBP0_9BACT|nr:type II secretion system F family protein [Roseiconus lacunae]MDM4013910.1 type II secretion system F family protein [Roseiconus lacunae]WRQ53213.1 type II secretion system F family protein [Stieleria sp. HD01]
MPEYSYVARSQGGKIQRGQMAAESLAALRSILESQGERLISAKSQEPPANLLPFRNPLDRLPARSITVEVALEQVAVMLESGLGILQALGTAAEQTTSQSMRTILQKVSEEIQEGDSLAEAMQRHKCFPLIAVQLARVGETTGNLDIVLRRAAEQMAARRENMSAVRTAVAYPAFVGIAAIGVAGYLVVFVIPELEKFLSSIGRRLPAITQSLLNLSIWIRTNGITVAILLVAVTIAMTLTYRVPKARVIVDRWLLRIPVMGKVLRLAGTVTFASSLGVMLRSGITVLEALRTVEGLHGNTHLASRVAVAREVVMEGGALAPPLAQKHGYMPMLSSMVAVGENTGQLDEVLARVTEFHEAQLQAAIKKLSALIEPLTIVVVGGIVGYVYLAFFMALFAAGG